MYTFILFKVWQLWVTGKAKFDFSLLLCTSILTKVWQTALRPIPAVALVPPALGAGRYLLSV